MNVIIIIIKLCIIIGLVGLFIWIRKNKIPMFCLACDEGGTYTRCMTGTGKGSLACNVYTDVNNNLDFVKKNIVGLTNEFTKVKDAIKIPTDAIKNAIDQLVTIFKNIPSIPKISDINIPSIPKISCELNLSDLPSFDPCITINKVVNAAIYPVNESIYGIQSAINGIIDTINSVTGTVGISGIDKGGAQIGKIGTINSNCNISLSDEVKKVLGPSGKLDVCKSLITAINDNIIKPFNYGISQISKGINIAIESINFAVTTVMNFIRDTIKTLISTIKKQLESINIFNGLVGKMTSLFSNIKSFNFISIVEIYVLPIVQNIIPFAGIMDALFIIALIILIPFIITILIIIWIIYKLISII
jgi:hypothetical protein